MDTVVTEITKEQKLNLVKIAVTRLYDAQNQRIRSDLRVGQLERDGRIPPKMIESILAKAGELEKEAEKEYQKVIANMLKDFPIIEEWLGRVKGIGPRLGGLFVAIIGDIGRFDAPSKLVAYAGMHTVTEVILVDGEVIKAKNTFKGFDTSAKQSIAPGFLRVYTAPHEFRDIELVAVRSVVTSSPRRKKGEKSNWNNQLKVTCWKAANSFMKARGRYYTDVMLPYKEYIIQREVDKGKIIYATVADKVTPVHFRPDVVPPVKAPLHPEWTLGRIQNMANRYTMKIFLIHLWLVWRKLEGMELRVPWEEQYGNGRLRFNDPMVFAEKD